MEQTVLLVGGTGFVGAHLKQALGSKYQVIAHGREVDVRDYRGLRKTVSIARPNLVVHLASITTLAESFKNPKETYDVIFDGTLNLLSSLKESGFKGRLLYISSSEVYGWPSLKELPISESQPCKPRSPYAVAKVAAEALCYQWSQEELFEIVIARPFNHIGPGQSDRFAIASFAKQITEIKKAKKEPVLDVGDIDVARDFTDVRDVVLAYIMLLERGRNGEIYNVCSGKEVSIRAIIDHFIQLTEIQIQVRHDPARMRESTLPRICGSYQKIQQEVGWEPKIGLNDTLRDILIDCGDDNL